MKKSSIQEIEAVEPPPRYRLQINATTFHDSKAISPHDSRPFRIIHISDPHLSRRYYRGHIKSLKLLLAVIAERGFDHIVISGDIVSTADEHDYALSREIFERFGLLRGDRLTVVPGNHDIFGGPHRAIDIMSFPRHIRSVDYRRHNDLFFSAFAETFDGAFRLSESGPYPFVKCVGPFLLIGINSISPWSLWKNPLGTNGLLDDSQIEGLRALTKCDLIRTHVPVVVIHHHFQDNAKGATSEKSWFERIESKTMRMKKRKSTLRLFESLNVKLVLHGHVHRNELYDRGTIVLANGAGSVCDDPVQFLKYNDIFFLEGTITLSTHLLPIPFHAAAPERGFGRVKSRKPAIPRLLLQPLI